MDSNNQGSLEIAEGNVFWKYEIDRSVASTSRPTLVLLHAAVTDHTLWDEQVKFLIKKGWTCLRVDLLGFGQSHARSEYLDAKDRKPIDYLRYIENVLDHVLGSGAEIILIGLSRGGGFALDFSVTHPERVVGLTCVAGGIEGFDHPNLPEEDEMFAKEEELLKNGDVLGLAHINVAIWANGPSQKPGRVSPQVADQLHNWYVNIARWECAGTGGSVLEFMTLDPPGIARLAQLNGKPVAVAYGVFDETHTTAAMKHIGKEVPNANLKEFATAHMVNLEKPREFNEWLLSWLDSNF